MNINDEPEYIHELYGTKPGKSSLANNILLARKLVEKGVRFVQIFDWGWDTHGTGPDGSIDIGLVNKSRQVDRAMTALLLDLKQRGLLDETLIIWCGEFGRLPIAQTGDKPGRDHNPHCFTTWLAGGGVRGGVSYGESDEIGFKAAVNRVHLNDLHATILHLLGLDHKRLTYLYNGRNFRLTDVAGEVIRPILA